MTKKISYISLINAVSCIAVVVLHTNGCFWQFSKERYWKTANLIECLAYFAVPCFFMITGATLLNYREKYSMAQFFKKRILKTFIPFVFWSLIGLAYALYRKNVLLSSLTVQYVYNGIVRTSFVGVYWFFISLFGMYLCIPLFAAVKEEARRQVFLYLVCAGTVINILIPFIIHVSGSDVGWPFTLTVTSGPLIYLPLGFLLRECDIKRRWRLIIYAAGLLGLLAHIFGTYYLSMGKGEIVQTYKGYTNLPCLLFSVAVFVFLKYAAEIIMRPGFISKAVDFFSGYTFSVYLMHWFLIDIIRRVFDLNTHRLIYRLGMPLIIIPLAVGIAWVIKKIPVLKRIVP
ncbi:MAG: acyltransferase [Clostridia bacterium]|nr:acyltransferase [Clostridia bacterium]